MKAKKNEFRANIKSFGLLESDNSTEFSVSKDISSNVENNKNIEGEIESTFPLSAFPLSIQKIIEATNESLNFPIDFIGASMLYAASVAIGNTYKVEVKNGFQESAAIYLALVARSGTNKSHPLTFAMQPILNHDKKSYLQYIQQRNEFEREILLIKKIRNKKLVHETTKPVWQKFILTDFTPEALAEVHKINKRGIGVYIDELAGWFKNFNRYKNGSEMEFWLSAWSSKPINIDRKSSEPVYISLPFISVCGTIQNGLLAELGKDNRTQNGFIDRILFVIPEGLKKPYWSETEIGMENIQSWDDIISKLLSFNVELDETLNPIPEILHFSTDAKQILFDWQRMNADRCNLSDSETMSGIYSKLEVYAARLALILEMMRWACGECNKQLIGIESINGALQLVEYFKKSAEKVHSIISNLNPLDVLSVDRQALYQALPEQFSTNVGLQVAKGLGMPERNFKRFIKNKELFNWLVRGEYEKRI